MYNYYYGIVVKDSIKESHSVHLCNIGTDIAKIDTENLCKFRTRWDCKFDWQPDPFELEHEKRLGVRNRRHGPVPVVSFVLKAENEKIEDVKEAGFISEERLESMFPKGTVVLELQRTNDGSSIAFYEDSYRSIQKKLIAI